MPKGFYLGTPEKRPVFGRKQPFSAEFRFADRRKRSF